MPQLLVRYIIVLLAGFALTCSSSMRSLGLPKGTVPKVRATFKAVNPAFTQNVPPYQEQLDKVLEKAALATKTFIPVYSSDSLTKADYEVSVLIDSVFLVCEEYQERQMVVIDSLKKKQEYINSESSRMSRFNPYFAPPGTGTAIIVLSLMSKSNQSNIDKSSIKPRITGWVEVKNLHSDRLKWLKKFNIENKYDRFVTYNEQLDMVFRILIGNIRFKYKTPFLYRKE
jgi:hypothetical protein